MNNSTDQNSPHKPMMIIPVYQNALVSIMKNNRSITGNIRPQFSFQYDGIQYSMTAQHILLNGEVYQMTADQQKEVDDFLETVNPSEEASRQYAENLKHLQYLRSTDWYVIRKTETGVEIPMDILESRRLAREAIDSSIMAGHR